MKKSLLIAPALGVLVLAAAGSVGGTVAWFTANSTWDVNASEFAVTKLDGNLKATITAYDDYGTTSADNNTVTVSDNMTDASANVTTPASIAIYSTHGTIASGKHYADHSGNWVAETAKTENGNKAVYWAVKWDILFSFDFPQNTKDVNLYFDTASVAQSKVGTAEYGTPGATEAAKGFRLAFVGQVAADGGTTTGSTANTRVWAPFRATSEASKVTYVQDVETKDAVSYAANTVIYSDADNQDFKDETKKNDKLATCLGTFHVSDPNTTAKLKFTCVAWFEGSDENVADEKVLGKVKASLKFFTRQDNPA